MQPPTCLSSSRRARLTEPGCRSSASRNQRRRVSAPDPACGTQQRQCIGRRKERSTAHSISNKYSCAAFYPSESAFQAGVLIVGWLFLDMIDHKNRIRTLLRFQFQAELFFNRVKE